MASGSSELACQTSRSTLTSLPTVLRLGGRGRAAGPGTVPAALSSDQSGCLTTTRHCRGCINILGEEAPGERFFSTSSDSRTHSPPPPARSTEPRLRSRRSSRRTSRRSLVTLVRSMDRRKTLPILSSTSIITSDTDTPLVTSTPA